MQGTWKWFALAGGSFLSARAVLASVVVGNGAVTWDGALEQLDVSLMPEAIRATWDAPSMANTFKNVQPHAVFGGLDESLGLDNGCSYATYMLFITDESFLLSLGSVEAIKSSTMEAAQLGTIGIDYTTTWLYLPARNLYEIESPIRQLVTVRMIAAALQ